MFEVCKFAYDQLTVLRSELFSLTCCSSPWRVAICSSFSFILKFKWRDKKQIKIIQINYWTALVKQQKTSSLYLCCNCCISVVLSTWRRHDWFKKGSTINKFKKHSLHTLKVKFTNETGTWLAVVFLSWVSFSSRVETLLSFSFKLEIKQLMWISL